MATTGTVKQRQTKCLEDSGVTRQDRNIVLANSGNLTWNIAGGGLTWAADFRIFIPGLGFNKVGPAGPVAIADGECLYVVLNRKASGSSISAQVKSVNDSAFQDDFMFLLCLRYGTVLYFREGTVLLDGETFGGLGRGP